MVSTLSPSGFGPFDDLPEDRGPWLAAQHAAMERAACPWLLELARFDAEGGFVLDGQQTVVGWLVWKTGLARPTAYEKVRVARALAAHDRLCDAYRSGRISYSAVRAISRIDDPPAETVAALVDLAGAGSVADVEMAVRYWKDCASQDLAPDERWARRFVGVGAPVAGLRRIEGLVTETEGDLIDLVIRAYQDRQWRQDHQQPTSPDSPPAATGQAAPFSAADQTTGEHGPFSGADGSARADTQDQEPGPFSGADRPAGTEGEPGPFSGADGSGRADTQDQEPGPFSAADQTGTPDTASETPLHTSSVRRADALIEIFRTALDHLNDTTLTPLGDHHMIHYLHHATTGLTTRPDGTPLHPDHANLVLCDTTTVDHDLDPNGQPLRQGRKTREWNTAQRRAILIRDGGTCRHPGCNHHRVDIHHVTHWEHGGPTDTTNGVLLCPYHHHLHHAGYLITGHPDATLHFARPDGTPIGTTTPRNTITDHLPTLLP